MNDKIKLVQHLADLGMLTFSEKEMQSMVGDMQDIIGLIDQIKQADVSGIQPDIKQTKFEDLRIDKARQSMPKEDILKNAAQTENGCFVVPKVVD